MTNWEMLLSFISLVLAAGIAWRGQAELLRKRRAMESLLAALRADQEFMALAEKSQTDAAFTQELAKKFEEHVLKAAADLGKDRSRALEGIQQPSAAGRQSFIRRLVLAFS